jgi:dihydroorotate dehydrogenase
MGGAVIYRYVLRPLLWLLPAETAHHAAFGALRLMGALPGGRALLRRLFAVDERVLAVRALGLSFANPLGLAAGFDKNAVGHQALGDLGFGFVEVGTVTADPQPGNPRPRLFRLARDAALVNRMGFNNDGAVVVSRRLLGPRDVIVGVNIGKTKVVPEEQAVADYVRSAARLGPVADYLVVNVSSPNTPGLRNLQAVEQLRPLLVAVREALDRAVPERRVPLLVKIAPDLADADVDAVADLALDLGLDGIIATNTTISRDGLRTPPRRVQAMGAGGLSGAPLEPRALAVLARLRARVGNRLVLIAAGGIATVEQAWARIRAGASLIQIYTALIYEGPLLPRRLLRGLAARARAEGYDRIEDAVGSGRERLVAHAPRDAGGHRHDG